MGVEICGYKTVYVDVDNTIAMDNLSDYPPDRRVTIHYTNGPIDIIPNKKNINLITLFYKLGYTVIVWSKTGSDWAKLVSEAVGLGHMACCYLTKPTFYIDDQEVEKWMGPKRWRDDK